MAAASLVHVMRLLPILFGSVVIAFAGACSADQPAPAPGTTTTSATTTSVTTTSTTTTSTTTTSTTTTAVPPPTPAPASPSSTPTTGALSAEYCAKNQDPGCPPGSYIGPDPILNPNPNQGAGTPVEGAPCEGTGRWVHLTGGNAAHYGTEWLCHHP